MIKTPAKPILLIPDNGPLGALAINGQDALDCLFALGAPVHITDMVIEEATRNQSLWWNKDIREWLERNRNRYVRVETQTGREYLAAKNLWERAGCPPDLEPKTSDKGDRSIQDAVEAYDGRIGPTETLMALVDDKKLRRRLTTAEVNVEILTTRALFKMIEENLHAGDAEAMWRMVKMANPTMSPVDRRDVVRNVRDQDDEPSPPALPPPWGGSDGPE